MSTTEKSSTEDCVQKPSVTTEPCVIVHGGIGPEYSAGSVFAEMVTACRISASLAYQKILSGVSAVDAVEAALWWLENDEFFNCGYGSVVNNEGYVEMDACMMNGTMGECGSVVAVRDVEHPISLARYVMEKCPNTIVAGEGAKRLAISAGINCLARESMIAPAVYFSNETKYQTAAPGYFNPRKDDGSGGSLGAVGCVVWDGRTIVVGTSSGGSRGKMVGRAGDSSLIGCGTFADRYSGCSLTGHGESIIKMGLARLIVEDCSFRTNTPRNCLKNNLEKFTDVWGKTAGGVVLRVDGSWGAYNSSRNPVPYAVVKNRRINFSSKEGEEIVEKYREPAEEQLCKCGTITAATRGVLDTRLFSFREWQRYVECRRAVLTNHHFPTKLKRDPEAFGSGDMYLKFITNVKSKSSDREEPEVKSYKHLIPRELTDAMRTSIEKLHESTNTMTIDAEFFGPSLTPQHSYLQQLLANPERDLPTILRADFNSMKIGYLTNPESLQALAEQCDIGLEVADTAIHFIEKIVPPFELSHLPTTAEFNEPVRVVQPPDQKTLGATSKTCEDATEYLHRKNPGSLYVDSSKLADYELSCKSLWHRRSEFVKEPPDDFGFDEAKPSGKLTVGDDSDSENGSVRSVGIDNDTEPNFDGDVELGTDFFAKYNVSLSSFEKSTVSCNGNSGLPKKPKRKLQRDPVTGKFVSVGNSKKSASEEKMSTTAAREKSGRHEKNEAQIAPVPSNRSKNCPDDEAEDPSTLNERNSYQRTDGMCGSHFLDSRSWEEFEKLYRPYTEYWMYRCNFGRVNHKNFRQFESELPDSFRWLLEECSSVVEMTSEDLYEEVCLVESYYADILSPSSLPSSGNRYDWNSYRSKAHSNLVTKKW